MKGDYKLVTPPSPLFLKSGDFRGFMGAVSYLESIGLELIDSKGVSRKCAGVFELIIAQTTSLIVTHAAS
jgi:hypothetical protein